MYTRGGLYVARSPKRRPVAESKRKLARQGMPSFVHISFHPGTQVFNGIIARAGLI
jgi:hypothetical protein